MRTAEVAGALSLATDIGMSEPFEHGLRSTLVTVQLGRRMGLSRAELAEAYDVSMLMYIGCTVDTHLFARYLGDEMVARHRMRPVVWGPPGALQRVMLPS